METAWSSNCNDLLGFVDGTAFQALGDLGVDGSLDLFFIALFSEIFLLPADMMRFYCGVAFDDEVWFTLKIVLVKHCCC